MELDQGKFNEIFDAPMTEILPESSRNRMELDQENFNEIFNAPVIEILPESSRNRMGLDQENFNEIFNAPVTEILPVSSYNRMELDQESFDKIFNVPVTEILTESSYNKMELDQENLNEIFDAPVKEILPEGSPNRMELDQENFNEIIDALVTEVPGSSYISKNRVRRNKRNSQGPFGVGNFQTSILRTNKILLPKMKLQKRTLQILDDFMFHLLEKFDNELRILRRKKNGKTLALKSVKTIMKLCLPKSLGSPAMEFARKAADAYFLEIQKKRLMRRIASSQGFE